MAGGGDEAFRAVGGEGNEVKGGVAALFFGGALDDVDVRAEAAVPFGDDEVGVAIVAQQSADFALADFAGFAPEQRPFSLIQRHHIRFVMVLNCHLDAQIGIVGQI